jgi:AcrR family transcriptional regulator
MNEPGKERADAARNRRAILAATERLLATHRGRDISMEQVAQAAGVGKGTVFHRFGSRTGLMTALMYERAEALTEAITGGPPPLGPGGTPRERLLAFLDAVVEMVARNKSLLAELAHTAAAEPGPAAKSEGKPVYSFWHGHLSALLAAEQPGLDAGLMAHLILGTLHSEPVLACLTADGPEQVGAALRTMIEALLDAHR